MPESGQKATRDDDDYVSVNKLSKRVMSMHWRVVQLFPVVRCDEESCDIQQRHSLARINQENCASFAFLFLDSIPPLG